MTSLTRTAVADFTLEESMPWSVVQDETAPWEEYILSIGKVLDALPHIEANDETFKMLRNGGDILSVLPDLPCGLSWISYQGKAAFLLEKSEEKAHYKAYLYGDG